MKNWALIDNGRVSEIIALDDGIVPGVDMFTPEIAANMVDATSASGVELDWIYTSKQFSPPPSTVALAPTVQELLAYASKKQNSILAEVWSFDVGTSDAPLKLTTKLDTAGQSAMTQLLVWSMAAQSGDTEPFSNVDYSSATITPAQAKNLALQAGAVKSASYACLNNLASGISASSPTITTEAQIDSASWPSPKS